MNPFITKNHLPIGYSALVKQYKLKIIPHHRTSYIAKNGRGSHHQQGQLETYIYPNSYSLSNMDDPLQQLEFAIKHEGIHLEIITGIFKELQTDYVTSFIKNTPTGKYTRIIWFLYEFITKIHLDLSDLKNVPYVDLLDPTKYYVSPDIKSTRHAVNNNLLGNIEYCPFIRRTSLLKEYDNKNLAEVANKLTSSVSPVVLKRAINFLYTKETKSSFGIEKIKPSIRRSANFISLLESAALDENLSKSKLVTLQNESVDQKYYEKDYRKTQNYVGELTGIYEHKVHYISPKPDDVHDLMHNFLLCEEKLLKSNIPPVIISAILSFGFVFIHPFEDGNGRIHRFIIHYILSKLGFTPKGMIFPVSSTIINNLSEYDKILEGFSIPLLKAIGQYKLSDDGTLNIEHDTKIHYQYNDYTAYAEYLYKRIERTIHEDYIKELDFIVKYDQTKLAIRNIVALPDFKIDRIIRCITNNNGMLGNKMSKTYFEEIADKDILTIEKIIKKTMLD